MAEDTTSNSGATSFINHIRCLMDRGDDIDGDRSHSTLLIKAIKYGYEPAVDYLLKKGANVNIPYGGYGDYDYTTPLLMAISQKNIRLTKKLIDYGADLVVRDAESKTMLHHAVIINFGPAVDLLLTEGDYVNVTDSFGNTPLHYCRDKNIAEKLLRKGANIDVQNCKGRTPLIQAVKKNFGSIKLLLKEGANVNMTDREGNSALHFASPQKTAKRLLIRGADVNKKNNRQETPLHKRVMGNRSKPAIKVLLNRGADVNSRNSSGSTPLHKAIAYPKIVKFLLNNGADLDKPDNSGQTPLDLALSNLNFNLVQRMFSTKTKVDLRDKSSEFPLHFALSIRNIVSVKDAMGGAQLECMNEKNQTPLHIAVLRNFRLGVQYLLENGSQVNVQDKWLRTPLHYAVLSKNNRIFQILWLSRADASIKDINGFTALHYAVLTENIKFVKEIAERKVELDNKDFSGQSALHMAINTGFTPIVNLLLANGANINIRNTEGKTPLHLSIFLYDNDLIHMLLDKGASIDVQDKNGKTPLHIAVEGHQNLFMEKVNILIDRGAALNIRDNDNKTPLSIAATRRWKPFDSYSMQIIKLKVVNLEIGESDEVINMFMKPCGDAFTYRNKCQEEVTRMKERKIGKHRLYDVFYKYSDPRFVKEPLMEEAVRSTSLYLEFPIYASLLKVTFNKARVRYELMDRAQEYVTLNINNPFRVVNIPKEIRRYTLSFLSDKDLRNFIKASNDVDSEAMEWDT